MEPAFSRAYTSCVLAALALIWSLIKRLRYTAKTERVAVFVRVPAHHQSL